MCNLCDDETREEEMASLRHHADALRSLARDLDALAEGRQKPHTNFAKSIECKAHKAIRYLVEEWLS